MGTAKADDSDEIAHLLRQAADGDEQSWRALLTRDEGRLRRMIILRLDQRAQGRVAPSDVLQETYVQAWKLLAEYLRDPQMPFFLWLRGIAGNKLREAHRHHLGAQKRDAGREVSIYRGTLPEATSAALANQLLGRHTRPSEAAVRAEVKLRLQEALNSMDPTDREVLVLRHFEQLTPAEIAQELGIKEKAASMRYLRAIKRLKEILTALPGGPWEQET
jgi:RNA polymerase sigma-70 factor, ECF subfamily